MHIYECQNGNKVPSVTTVLELLGNTEIIKWANYLGFKHIDYIHELNRTAVRGTKVHQCLQYLVDPKFEGKEVTFKDDIEKSECLSIIENFTSVFTKDTYETIFTEKAFASSEYGYGGTIDWHAKIKGHPSILDYKTSKKVRLKHIIQISAYTKLLEENGYDVEYGIIILINQTLCKPYVIKREQMDPWMDLFDSLLKVYTQYQEGIPKNVEFPK